MKMELGTPKKMLNSVPYSVFSTTISTPCDNSASLKLEYSRRFSNSAIQSYATKNKRNCAKNIKLCATICTTRKKENCTKERK